MKWLGDAYSGCTLHDSWTTVTTTGAPTALLGRPGDLSSGNAFPVVWRMLAGAWTCSTAGVTVAFDCNGATGWNTYSVNTNADPSFYACGKDYAVVFHGGTVGGTCVSYYTLATFSLKNRASLLPTVSARQLDVSAGGEGGIDWANIGSPQTAQSLGCTALFSVHTTCNSVVASSVAAGAIATTSFAAGAIDAAAIAANAIGASELAADVITDIWQGTTLTESYAADAAAATPSQLLHMIFSAVANFSVTGTSIVTKQLDGCTTAMTFLTNDPTSPTDRTRLS